MPVKAAGHQQDFNYMRKARFSAMSSQLGGFLVVKVLGVTALLKE